MMDAGMADASVSFPDADAQLCNLLERIDNEEHDCSSCSHPARQGAE
jgi:hypothetical protein